MTDKERMEYSIVLQTAVESFYQQYMEKRAFIEVLCNLFELTEDEKQFVFKNVK